MIINGEEASAVTIMATKNSKVSISYGKRPLDETDLGRGNEVYHAGYGLPQYFTQ